MNQALKQPSRTRAVDTTAGRPRALVNGRRKSVLGESFGYQVGALTFIRLFNLVRLAHHLVDMHPRYWRRALFVGLSSFAGEPLRWLERLCHGRSISRVELKRAPIFIIGHWRSGTTHLHNLMSQDAELGYLSMYQATAPDCSLVGGSWLRAVLSRLVPVRRPMDNMTWPMAAPQEEEVALAKVSPYSFYTQFMFPRKALALFRSHVLLEDAGARAAAEFKRAYHRLLQIATLHAGGKRLVLKNPVNSARIPTLLALYPDARFIHIHRSPYDVYASTKNLHRKILSYATLQDVDSNQADRTVLSLYELVMKQLLKDREQIPPGHLMEVRFEDLERDPVAVMRSIYSGLGLPGFAGAEPALRVYVDAQASYRKNGFELTGAERRLVEQRWGFAFCALGYAREQ